MEIVIDEFEVKVGKRNMDVIAGLRMEHTDVAREYLLQMEAALCAFNRAMSCIIRKSAAV